MFVCMCVHHSELEGKDVEEVFTAVLHPNNGDNNQLEQRQNNTAAGKTHTPQTGRHIQFTLESSRRRWKPCFLFWICSVCNRTVSISVIAVNLNLSFWIVRQQINEPILPL